MTSIDPMVTDIAGTTIEVGSRVKIPGFTVNDREPPETWNGEVTEISDPDGDVDEFGRNVFIPPYVTVLFDNGDEDRFSSYVDHQPYYFDEDDLVYICDDVEVVK